MKKAVINILEKQYLVTEGQSLEVDSLPNKVGEQVEFKVLAVVDGNKTQLGQPIVSGAKVSAKVDSQFSGRKVRIEKFKSKKRYHKVRGHRQPRTSLTIEKISL